MSVAELGGEVYLFIQWLTRGLNHYENSHSLCGVCLDDAGQHRHRARQPGEADGAGAMTRRRIGAGSVLVLLAGLLSLPAPRRARMAQLSRAPLSFEAN